MVKLNKDPLEVIILFALIGWLIHSSLNNKDSNATLEYGDTGLPKNCRAIIKANIEAYYNHQYSADEIIKSIDRNCGEFGHSWGEK